MSTGMAGMLTSESLTSHSIQISCMQLNISDNKQYNSFLLLLTQG